MLHLREISVVIPYSSLGNIILQASGKMKVQAIVVLCIYIINNENCVRGTVT